MSVNLRLSPDQAITYLQDKELSSLHLSSVEGEILIQQHSILKNLFTNRKTSFEKAAKLLIERALVKTSEHSQKFIEKIEAFAKDFFDESLFQSLRNHERSSLQMLVGQQTLLEAMETSTKEHLQNLFAQALKEFAILGEEELEFLKTHYLEVPLIKPQAEWVHEQSLQLQQEIVKTQEEFLNLVSIHCQRDNSLTNSKLALHELMTKTNIHVSTIWKKRAALYLPRLNFLQEAIRLRKLINDLKSLMNTEFEFKMRLNRLKGQFSDAFLKTELGSVWLKATDDTKDELDSSISFEFGTLPPEIQAAIITQISNFRQLEPEIAKQFESEKASVDEAILKLEKALESLLEESITNNSFDSLSQESSYCQNLQREYEQLSEKIHLMNGCPEKMTGQAYEEMIEEFRHSFCQKKQSFCLNQTQGL